jgi:muramoyltetrapeptide carboxypeptidase
LSSASIAKEEKIEEARKRLENLGLKVLEGDYIHANYKSFAGTDEQRVEDLHQMFADKN